MNVEVNFENRYQVKDTTQIGTVKVVMLKGEKGDTGASGDYATLLNKPKINGEVLDGDKTASQLHLASAEEMSSLSAIVDQKADASTVSALSDRVAEEMSSLSEIVDQKADASTVSALSDLVDEKVDESTLENYYTKTAIDNQMNQKASVDAVNAHFPVAIAEGGTGATTAATARTNLGAVSKSGDTMTGDLEIKYGSYPMLRFIRSDGSQCGAFMAQASTGRLILRNWNSDGSYYVDYNLPDDSDNSAFRARYLLTTKDFPYSSYDQESGTLVGMVNGTGVFFIACIDSGNTSNYYIGVAFHTNGSNPVVTTIANNGLSYGWGNTIGTCVFSGATGNYVARAIKLV